MIFDEDKVEGFKNKIRKVFFIFSVYILEGCNEYV